MSNYYFQILITPIIHLIVQRNPTLVFHVMNAQTFAQQILSIANNFIKIQR